MDKKVKGFSMHPTNYFFGWKVGLRSLTGAASAGRRPRSRAMPPHGDGSMALGRGTDACGREPTLRAREPAQPDGERCMIAFVVKRLVGLALTLLAASFIVFP